MGRLDRYRLVGRILTAAHEVHRSCDGVQTVDAEGHQDVGRCIDDHGLPPNNASPMFLYVYMGL